MSVASKRTLYVSDLDQTLLTSHGTISAETAQLLNASIDAGVLFTYATARSFQSSRAATRELQLNLPVITYGGTITADPDTGRSQDLRLLGESIVNAAQQHCARHPHVEPVWHTYEDGRDWVRWRPNQASIGLQTFLDARPRDPRLRPVTAADPLNPSAVFYVSILADTATLTGLRNALRPHLVGAAHFLSADATTPGLDWLEFHSEQGTKAAAIQSLMSELDVDRLVVFGDNHNDLPMFQIADESYAVSNAVPDLQDAATGVIDSNDQDAVARWIVDDHVQQAAG